MTADDRYTQGLRRLHELHGEASTQIVAGLQASLPALGPYIVAFGFGEIYSRPGLDAATREITTIAALTALGTAPGQLKAHIHTALAVGVTCEQLTEVIVHLVLFAGFPAAMNALALLDEASAERG